MTAYACNSGADRGADWDLPGWLRKTFAESGFGSPRSTRGSWHGGARGWGWGPPGGGDAWGAGPRGTRGPRAGRGDVRSALLALLAEQPMHGYQMIQEIGNRSGGAWKPSPGSVYPTLQQLEDEGLIRAREQDGRRVYDLTDMGRRVTADRAEEFASLWEGVAPTEKDTQLGDLVFQVGAAFVQVARTGTPDQLAEARKVLARTRADLYRILGQDPDGSHGHASGKDSPSKDTQGEEQS